MLVLGAAGILAAVVTVMAVIDLGREKQYMTQLLLEKGAALIKAFEAGARTGMGRLLGSLKDFSATERKELPFLLDTAADAVEAVVTEGIVAAQNRIHARP